VLNASDMTLLERLSYIEARLDDDNIHAELARQKAEKERQKAIGRNALADAEMILEDVRAAGYAPTQSEISRAAYAATLKGRWPPTFAEAMAAQGDQSFIDQIAEREAKKAQAKQAKRKPKKAGFVYRIRDKDADGSLAYVGKSVSEIQRAIAGHRSDPWWPEHVQVDIDTFPTERAALFEEAMAIIMEFPSYNKDRPVCPFRHMKAG
jgi:hypothetical protein